jgi:hypothetical protein
MATGKRTTRRTGGAQSENGAAPPTDAAPGVPAPKATAPKPPTPKASAPKARSRKPKAAAAGRVRNDEDRHASIARAAYLRSQNRGFQPGFELEDWLAAEAEVDQRPVGEGHASHGSSGER